jgi:hypothetical protein
MATRQGQDKVACSRVEQNLWLFDFADDVTDDMNADFGTDFDRRRMNPGNIKKFGDS